MYNQSAFSSLTENQYEHLGILYYAPFQLKYYWSWYQYYPQFLSWGKYDVMCFQNIQGQFITRKPILDIVKFSI